MRQNISTENDHYKKIYDRLIKASKDLEDKVTHERKQQKRYQYKINTLEQELSLLNDQDKMLDERKAKVNDDFLEEKAMNDARTKVIAQLSSKYQQLKDTKKEKHYKNCMLKNQYAQIIKTFMRNMEINE